MAGAGYKLFNTGDVLTAAQVNTFLMEQTVMVFADAAARTTALTGVVSEGMLSYLKSTKQVEVYNGTAWVASDDPNAIQNTIVDAKGDLIAATANDTPARLAVGSNGDTLVADSAASTGLRYTAGVGQVNPIINSAYQIWQRGTSIAISGNTPYTADRWTCGRQGGSGATVSRQLTNDSTNLPFIQYAMRLQRDSGNTSTNIINFAQSLESINSIYYAGKTVTVSVYARVGANYSGGSTFQLGLATGTGTDQNLISVGFTGAAYPINVNPTISTTWQRFSATGTLSSTLNQIAVFSGYFPTGTAGANDWLEVTGWQIDVGSVALPFRTAGGTLQGETALCQRYYFRRTAEGTNSVLSEFGGALSTTSCRITINPPVQMRVLPTATDYTALTLYDAALNSASATGVTINSGISNKSLIYIAVDSSGLTQYRPYQIISSSSSGYLGFSAEL